MKVNKKIGKGTALVWLFLAISCFSLLAENGRADAVIFSTYSPGGVSNGGMEPVFTTSQNQMITMIRTYHWNNGNGASPGSIGIAGYGSWPATGEPEGSVPNAYWVAYPNIQLPPGTYRITDSDASTWSQNSGTGGVGFAWVFAS